MKTSKLTLSVPDPIIEKAKRFALQKHTSVSKLFIEFVNAVAIIEREPEDDKFLEKVRRLPVSPEIKALTGILKGIVPDDVDLRKLKYEYLKEKHGL